MSQTPHPDEHRPDGAWVDDASEGDASEERLGVTPADIDDSLADPVDELTHTGDARTDDPR